MAGQAQDIEWAIGPGEGGPREVSLLQTRPETVWSQKRSEPLAAPGSTVLERIVQSMQSAPRTCGPPNQGRQAVLRWSLNWPDAPAIARSAMRASIRPGRRSGAGCQPDCSSRSTSTLTGDSVATSCLPSAACGVAVGDRTVARRLPGIQTDRNGKRRQQERCSGDGRQASSDQSAGERKRRPKLVLGGGIQKITATGVLRTSLSACKPCGRWQCLTIPPGGVASEWSDPRFRPRIRARLPNPPQDTGVRGGVAWTCRTYPLLSGARCCLPGITRKLSLISLAQQAAASAVRVTVGGRFRERCNMPAAWSLNANATPGSRGSSPRIAASSRIGG
jgi:hypothetical protein